MWRGDGEARIGTSSFDGERAGDADDAIAEPVRGADQNPKRFQFGARGNINAALVIREEELRLGRFPPIVHPEPIFWRGANLRFDGVIAFRGDRVHRIARRIEAFSETHSPPRRARRRSNARDHRGVSPLREQTAKRRGRGEPSEERRPHTMIAGVLVAQTPDQSAGAQQFNRPVETFRAIVQFHVESSSRPADMRVDVTVSESLINRPDARVIDEMHKDLREEFPVTDVTEEQDDGLPGAELTMHRFEILDLDMTEQLFRRHRSHLDAAKKVRRAALKVPARNLPKLAFRFFATERDLEIAHRQPPIFPKKQPRQEAAAVAESKQETKWKRARDCGPGAIQKVDAEIEHAGATSRRTRVEG